MTARRDVKSVCVLGLGYIGLPTAALLASKGYDVLGVDVAEEVVETINQGKIHIVEPDLNTYVESAVYSGKLKCSTKPDKSDVFIIAVPTPFHEGYVPNVDYIRAATESIAPYVEADNIIVLESTSPVGATRDIKEILGKKGVDTATVHIAHCPERVLPGRIMVELIENDRIVGGVTDEATKATADFYRTFVTGEVLETDSTTAEMAKLTENSFRDVNIAFANELSMLCDKFGIDVWKLIKLANHHPRVNILRPSVGVGGHCIAVDPWFIVDKAKGEAKIIETARVVNLHKTEWVVDKIKAAVAGYKVANGKENPKIACLGLSYKPDIDDLRESPAIEIVEALRRDGLNPLISEPNVKRHKAFSLVDYRDAAAEADLVFVLVPHKEFKDLSSPKVIDFCGMHDE